ncbi:MAG TPA: phosphodiester glycosidase family protein [Atribacteraceae bacterium]|nr:phosphodiester glycosidase family protein [Atribacteraceae bacterium]
MSNRSSIYHRLNLYVLILCLIFTFNLPALAQSSAVTWGELASSIQRIFGTSAPIEDLYARRNQSVSRLEAARTILRAMHYHNLYSYVDISALPFPDTQRLNQEQKQVVALATTINPPLMTGDMIGNFRPAETLSHREFAFLEDRLKIYARGEVFWETRRPIDPGIELVIRKRGMEGGVPPQATPVPGQGVILQAGAFADRERAERVAQWLRELGYTPEVVAEGGLFKVRVGPYPSTEVPSVQERLSRQGFPSVIASRINAVPITPSARPVFTLALLVDPEQSPYRAEVALARDTIVEREYTSELLRRKGGLFAINAGFFTPDGTPIGLLMINRRILSEPFVGWFVCGITPDNELIFGEVKMDAEVILPNGESYPITGINRRNRNEELILFDSTFGYKTPRQNGYESVIEGGRVIRTGKTTGETVIPRGGFVLQGQGAASEWMRRSLIPGTALRLRMVLFPSGEDLGKWKQTVHMVSGGPLLFRDGVPGPFGNFREEIVNQRHPRTVVGLTRDGRHLYLVADGRRPGHSAGLTIRELVEELKRYDVIYALNLDGGGSSTFVLNGEVLNRPADLTGERKISTAIILR